MDPGQPLLSTKLCPFCDGAVATGRRPLVWHTLRQHWAGTICWALLAGWIGTMLVAVLLGSGPAPTLP